MNELLGSLKIDEEEIVFLSRDERRARIRAMLTSTDKFGQLPSEVISLVEDESYLDLFETNMNMKVDRRVLRNSLYAIRYLADAWDGRCIRRHHSIRPLLELYREADAISDSQIKLDVVSALCAIDSSSTREFLVGILREGDRELTAEILSEWQRMHDWEDIGAWLPQILPLLHHLTSLPDDQCLYFRQDFGEQDVRFWVFRCLQGLRRRSSRRFIEAALASMKAPLETFVEAAYAHWCVTGSQQYLTILTRAARSRNSNAKRFLDKIKEKAEKKLGREKLRNSAGARSTTTKETLIRLAESFCLMAERTNGAYVIPSPAFLSPSSPP